MSGTEETAAAALPITYWIRGVVVINPMKTKLDHVQADPPNWQLVDFSA